jgi:hypothetical protein
VVQRRMMRKWTKNQKMWHTPQPGKLKKLTVHSMENTVNLVFFWFILGVSIPIFVNIFRIKFFAEFFAEKMYEKLAPSNRMELLFLELKNCKKTFLVQKKFANHVGKHLF